MNQGRALIAGLRRASLVLWSLSLQGRGFSVDVRLTPAVFAWRLCVHRPTERQFMKSTGYLYYLLESPNLNPEHFLFFFFSWQFGE